MKSANSSVIAITIAAMLTWSLPARAGIVGTERMLEQESRSQALDRVDLFLAQETVESQLLAWGVAPDLVRERLDAMTEMELQQLAANLDTDPAGGGALAVIGVVFVVLLILELTGITNIFRTV
jgi:hypothetical protein